MQLFSADATIFLKFLIFFRPQKVEKTTLKSCSEKLKSTFFSLLTWATQTTQTEEFMFQNVAYRPTVYRTGDYTIYEISKISMITTMNECMVCDVNLIGLFG